MEHRARSALVLKFNLLRRKSKSICQKSSVVHEKGNSHQATAFLASPRQTAQPRCQGNITHSIISTW